MRSIILLFLLGLSKLCFALQIENNTPKDYIIKLSPNNKIIIPHNSTIIIDDNIIGKLKIDIAVSAASMYKITNTNNQKIFYENISGAEVLFNQQIIGTQIFHSELSKYQKLTITFWDPSKLDDAIRVLFEKKPGVRSKDYLDAKLDVTCSIF